MSQIKILIVDDHPILRDGIRALLSLYDDIAIVGEAYEGKESIEKARECSPDVILMDIVMPGMNGLEATRCIKKQSPTVKVLVLTQYEDKEYVLAAIKAGVAGYVPKRAVGSELVTAIHTVHRGDTFLYPSATKILLESYVQQVEGEPYDRLTAREKEILRLVAAGYTSQEIGQTLQISLRTVQGHRLKIAKKLGLRNLAEIVKYAMHKGLLDDDT